jgi:fructoselysine-6-P-deglycase FrlB-like protein
VAELKVDRAALKELVTTLRKAEAEWCVACGAGASSAKLDFPNEVMKQYGSQFLEAAALREFITNVKDSPLGKSDWCVACGAGAAASPLQRNEATTVSDAEIDQLSQKLLSAVRGA